MVFTVFTRFPTIFKRFSNGFHGLQAPLRLRMRLLLRRAAARACAHAVPVPALPLERTAALAAAPALAALPTLFGAWQAADINQRGVLSSKACMLVRVLT